MSNLPSTNISKQNYDFEDDEVFDDSSFLAKFDTNSFKQSNFNDNFNDSINKSGLNVR